jgi:hypothetical protein
MSKTNAPRADLYSRITAPPSTATISKAWCSGCCTDGWARNNRTVGRQGEPTWCSRFEISGERRFQSLARSCRAFGAQAICGFR